jgi:hypothetical protein
MLRKIIKVSDKIFHKCTEYTGKAIFIGYVIPIFGSVYIVEKTCILTQIVILKLILSPIQVPYIIIRGIRDPSGTIKIIEEDIKKYHEEMGHGKLFCIEHIADV